SDGRVSSSVRMEVIKHVNDDQRPAPVQGLVGKSTESYHVGNLRARIVDRSLEGSSAGSDIGEETLRSLKFHLHLTVQPYLSLRVCTLGNV
ncbi:MAG: hypothetical protein Q9196_001472, partial [Gyalolechia fulgens]